MEPAKTALVLIEFHRAGGGLLHLPRTSAAPRRTHVGVPTTARAAAASPPAHHQPTRPRSFTSEGGKLHGAVKAVMAASGMLANARATVDAARQKGALIVHVPITCGSPGGARVPGAIAAAASSVVRRARAGADCRHCRLCSPAAVADDYRELPKAPYGILGK
jgi:hypothetical protein